MVRERGRRGLQVAGFCRLSGILCPRLCCSPSRNFCISRAFRARHPVVNEAMVRQWTTHNPKYPRRHAACGLSTIELLITHPKVHNGAKSPTIPAFLRLSVVFREFFPGASKKRSRNPYIHPLFQMLKVSLSYAKKRYLPIVGVLAFEK